MNTKTTLPISQARSDIFKIADEVQKIGTRYTLTERGVPKVVLMSADEFDSWQETMEVKKMFPNLDQDIIEAKKDFKTGNYKNFTTLDEILAKEEYVLAVKPKRKYAVSSATKAKSGKRTGKNSR